MKTFLRILDKDEHEQLVMKFRREVLKEENVGFTILSDGSTLPCVRVHNHLFRKLVEAGSIDVVSRVSVYNLYPHFYVKLELSWSTIKEKETLIFNGWRDTDFLAHLCYAQRLALTASNNSAIICDGINTEQLKAMLVINSMTYHSRECVLR